ncbi:MAG: GWxTD domain-containing protein [Calditrichaeota bacterium]|nr:GWxTD domain-containing protein [Calditrichota bacterium]MCB9391631.1 GWxTD domain-containing protein [Calditrichota bacterium]
MWKLCTAGLIALIFSSAALAQAPRDDSPEFRGFRCQAGQRLSSKQDSALIYIALSVPYDNLTFVRAESGGFRASIEATFLVFNKEGGLSAERTVDMDVHTASFKETNSRTINAIRTEEFYVTAGDYDLSVIITDKESKRKRRWTGEISPSVMDALLSVSDLYWMDEDTLNQDFGMPRVIENFSVRDDSALAGLDLISSAQVPLDITWKIIAEDGDAVFSLNQQLVPTSTVQHLDYVVHMKDLPVQKYKLTFEALGSGRREFRELPFTVNIPGVPPSITDLGLAIRQVKYIASTEENRRLRSASISDREALFREFWKRRDPSPDTPQNELMDEYYFRVEYSNERFSTHRPGWETDRGRIFILYGEPTDIERHPFESGSRPYEIWYYHNLNRKFVFVDHTGFGDYSLAGPQWGY